MLYPDDPQPDLGPNDDPPDPGLKDSSPNSALLADLVSVINRHSRENASNTPDMILAVVMLAALQTFEVATTHRDMWYGIAPAPGWTAPPGAVQPNREPEDDGLRYRLWSNKKNAWWRRAEFGYTSDPNDAEQYTRAEALKRVAQSALSGRVESVTCMVVVPPTGGGPK